MAVKVLRRRFGGCNGKDRGGRNPFGAAARPTPVLIVRSAPTGRYRAAPPPAVEARLDLLRATPTPARVAALLAAWRESGVAVLLTARRVADGGRWPERDEAARRALLLECAALAPEAIDLETDLLDDRRFRRAFAAVRAKRTALIASLHRFRPLASVEPLERAAEAARRHGADRFKAAIAAENMEEAARLADWALARQAEALPVTLIALGGAGAWTRWVLPLILGGPAYAPAGRALAPGQIPYRRLAALLDA